jgi:hypothetical protein
MLVGSAELMARARVHRKALGGGMRQAGVLAAAGLIALEEGPARLGEDHANARLLAEALANIEGVSMDLDSVETNIVVFRLAGIGAAELAARLKSRGVMVGAFGRDAIRVVTHRDVGRDQCIVEERGERRSLGRERYTIFYFIRDAATHLLFLGFQSKPCARFVIRPKRSAYCRRSLERGAYVACNRGAVSRGMADRLRRISRSDGGDSRFARAFCDLPDHSLCPQCSSARLNFAAIIRCAGNWPTEKCSLAV